jgi:hypothetical protein
MLLLKEIFWKVIVRVGEEAENGMLSKPLSLLRERVTNVISL